MAKTPQSSTKFRNLWLLGICIHILTFLFVLDLYFTSPIKHGMTPHRSLGEPFAKRVVVFIADGLRAEAIYPREYWDRVKYLSELRLNKSCSWGIVHTGVPTESRPGHVAIFAGLMEDPSALFTGWQANTVEFDSVINESNYAWSYGSPDIVKIFTKKDKVKLFVDHYDPDQEDFSGRTSTINLDTWVFNHIEDLLTPKGNSCEAESIRQRTKMRRLQQENLNLLNDKAKCQVEMDTCKGKYYECYNKMKPCLDKVAEQLDILDATLKEVDSVVNELSSSCDNDENNVNFLNYECNQLCKDGNLFFLHLLGMDTAGHVHKPNSREYLENLHAVDKGIQETTLLFEEFFNDNETVFIFTADHGMTNWGSHGDGSEHETEVPYILWGKGVKENKLRQDLKQTDLAPLLASLIGVPIPVNSVGILPYRLLNGTNQQIAEAVLANVMQHVEQYKLLLGEFELDPLFTEYPIFKGNYIDDVVNHMNMLIKSGDPEENVVRLGEDFMKDILAANNYMRNYYFKPKVITVMLGFLLWIIYLSLSIHVREETKNLGDEKRIRLWQFFMRIFTFLLMIVAVFYLKGLQVKYFTYIYPVFLLGILTLVSEDKDVVNQLWIMLNMENKTKFVIRTLIYAVLVQLLVFGFFNRLFCAGVVLILAFWLTQNGVSINFKATWLGTTLTLALLQIMEPSTKFNYYGLGIGSALWIFVYFTYILPEGKEYIKRFDLKYKITTQNIILTPLCAYLVASGNALYVAYAFDSEFGLSDLNLVISWVVTAGILLMIPTAPKGALTRFGHISASLIIPYALMAVNIDLIFYAVLVLTLYYWMEIEAKVHSLGIGNNEENPLQFLHFSVKYCPGNDVKVSDLYRRTYFYLALTVCYFFAIGNMASFNGFDPQWTRTYVATFNPILMATLIIIKMIIPFFLITCAFYAIVLHSKANDTRVFTILLLFLDQMVLNFMLFVRNEGSWKEIGKSLSQFAVMEAMALVMLIFFGIARYVCSFRIGDAGTGYEPPDDDRQDSDTNIQALIEEGMRKRQEKSLLYENDEKSYAGSKSKDKIKSNVWYLRDFLTCSPKKSNPLSSDVKTSKSDSSLKFPQSFFNCYVTDNDKKINNSLESGGVDSNFSCEIEKSVKSQEIQCKFEDETNSSNKMYKHFLKSSPLKEDKQKTLEKFEKIFSGTKKEIFQVAFDLGIAATIEHCHEKLKKEDRSEKSSSKRKKRRKSDQNSEIPTPNVIIQDKPVNNSEQKIFSERNNETEAWEPIDPRHQQNPVYNFTYYDIFPTVDKIQAKELRTIHQRPFSYNEGYLNISTQFNKNAEGESTGMISHPSYDDVDCHFYSANYSTQSIRSCNSSLVSKNVPKHFRASFFAKKSYKMHIKRINSVPHLETVQKVVNICKVPSESDIKSRLLFEESLLRANKDLKPEKPAGDLEENSLKKQLEKFNLSKAVYSTIKPGMNLSSKISIIRTESYFDPKELGPAGSRVFRESRTSFNSPDVLKLAPGLTREESIYYFMTEEQRADLVQKLLASNRVKTPHEQNLIDEYFKQLVKNNTELSCSGSSTVSSVHDKDDPFEILHKDAVRNEKNKRHENRERMRRYLAEAKDRENERLLQEKLSKQRAEEAVKAEEERKLKALRSKQNSSICLVPSQAVFNLGIRTQSEIKILQTDIKEEPLKLELPEEENPQKNVPEAIPKWKKDQEKKPKVDPKALEAFQEVAQIIANQAMKMIPEHDHSTPEMPKPGNFQFRQKRTTEKTKLPTTKSPLIETPVKRKSKTELDTSSESDEEGKSKDKRKKRRKLKTPKDLKDSNIYEKQQTKQTPKTREKPIQQKQVDSDTQNGSSKSSKESPKNETPRREPVRNATFHDRYDKGFCARKRPSPKFISNAHEMALKMSQVPGDSESDSVSTRIARLPIRIVPGILSTGKPFPQGYVVRPNRSAESPTLLQPPSEEVIKEERELDSASLSMSSSKSNALMIKRPRNKQFMKSSPTLIRLHSNSTLITEPKASENRLSNDRDYPGTSGTSSSDSDDILVPVRLDETNFKLPRSFVQLNENLSAESMPDSMILSSRTNDSDPTSIYSDLPEDDAVFTEEMGNSQKSISFEGVTTSMKKTNVPEETHGPNTCFDLYSVSKDFNLEFEEDEPDFGILTLSSEEDLRTPRFLQDDSDPSKYLVKVESWLKNIDSSQQQSDNQSPHFEESSPRDADDRSESTITTADLINEGTEVFTVPTVKDHNLISIEIAKSLIEEQRKTESNSRMSLSEAYKTVQFIFRCARNIQARSPDSSPTKTTNAQSNDSVGSSVIRKLETNDNTSQTLDSKSSVSTETSPNLESKCVGSDQISIVSNTTQTQNKSAKGKIRSRSKFSQCVTESASKETLTEDFVERVTSNIGIQHSFTEIGVGTERPPEICNTSAQICVKMVDAQVSTDIERKVDKRDIGVSPIVKSVRRKVNHRQRAEIHEERSSSPISDDFNAMGEGTKPPNLKLPDVSEPLQEDSAHCKPDFVLPKVPEGRFASTVENLRVAIATKTKFQKSELKLENIKAPVLPDELCSQAELQRKHQALALEKLEKISINLQQQDEVIPVQSTSTLTETSEIKSISKPAAKRRLNRHPKKLGVRKLIHHPSQSCIQTPESVESIMSRFAREEGSKPYKPATDVTIEMQGQPNPRPKVKSIPRTDFAELPEEHQEVLDTDINSPVTPLTSVTSGQISSISRDTTRVSESSAGLTQSRQTDTIWRNYLASISTMSSNLSTVSTGSSTISSESVLLADDGSDMANTWKQFSAVVQRWRRQGMSEEQICKEIEKQQNQ